MSRQAFTGSCHCGQIKYITYITVPHTPSPEKGKQNIYRCNCTICHKAAIFHVRLNASADDFLLLSPQDPFEELGNYKCNDGGLNFFFCKNCGVRCFTFMGPSKSEELKVEDLGLSDAQKEKLGVKGKVSVVVWKGVPEGWKEGRSDHGMYVSVNGHSIDQGQDGFDMGELVNKKLVGFLDYYKEGNERGRPSLEKPHPWGSY